MDEEGKGKWELAFWGGTDIEYERYHPDPKSARAEAERVHGLMDDKAAHPGIIYDPNGKQRSAVM